MLSFLTSTLGILITIIFVIGVHEWGHFIVARLCGVKVLRFSMGFGKPLFAWHDKQGTEYVLAAIPLGGYVKMLDESEENVIPEERHRAFNNQAIYKKMAIIAAGPLANFIFAFLLYWLLFVIGFASIKPIIGTVLPHSIAEQAGLKSQQTLIQIDKQPIFSWQNAAIRIISRAGEQGTMQMVTQSLSNQQLHTATLELATWQMDNLNPDPLKSLGLVPYEPSIPPIIGVLQRNSPAMLAHLNTNDKILAINNQTINSWPDIIKHVANAPDKTLEFKILRAGKILILPVHIGSKQTLLLKKQGFLGITPNFTLPTHLLQNNQYSPVAAIPYAMHEVMSFIKLNVVMISKIILGKISLQSLGGPISIFESAGTALNQGIIPFLGFLAFLSISIGFINIIPIPGLDGGHLLFQLIEFVIRRPLSQRLQLFFYRIGLILLVLLIFQALANDVMRL